MNKMLNPWGYPMIKLICLLACVCMVVAGCLPEPGPEPEPQPEPEDIPNEGTLHIFHNNRGTMCLEALAWLGPIQQQYSDLEVREHLSDDPAELALFQQWRAQFESSQGVSTDFGYWPMIFYSGQAYSGFNAQIAEELTTLIESAYAPAP